MKICLIQYFMTEFIVNVNKLKQSLSFKKDNQRIFKIIYQSKSTIYKLSKYILIFCLLLKPSCAPLQKYQCTSSLHTHQKEAETYHCHVRPLVIFSRWNGYHRKGEAGCTRGSRHIGVSATQYVFGLGYCVCDQYVQYYGP